MNGPCDACGSLACATDETVCAACKGRRVYDVVSNQTGDDLGRFDTEAAARAYMATWSPQVTWLSIVTRWVQP